MLQDVNALTGTERYIKPKNFGDAKKIELHHFSDASEVGYGAVTSIKRVRSIAPLASVSQD